MSCVICAIMYCIKKNNKKIQFLQCIQKSNSCQLFVCRNWTRGFPYHTRCDGCYVTRSTFSSFKRLILASNLCAGIKEALPWDAKLSTEIFHCIARGIGAVCTHIINHASSKLECLKNDTLEDWNIGTARTRRQWNGLSSRFNIQHD